MIFMVIIHLNVEDNFVFYLQTVMVVVAVIVIDSDDDRQ
jgi:hypothetical protein